MKAPDKIYACFNMEDGEQRQLWATVPLSDTEQLGEYIRKDALLEWAKEKYNEYKQMDEDFQGDVFVGNRHAFAEVIHKIESM